MYVSHLDLASFRSFPELHVDFQKGINYLLGMNAAGKTNLIEAIYYLSLGRSFKKAQDREIIKLGEKEADIILKYRNRDDEEHVLEARIQGNGKNILLDGEKVPSVARILGKLLCVVYAPQSVSLFRDSPSERRRVIDQTLSLLSPQYLYALTRYKKMLKERNTALSLNYDEDVLNVITNELVTLSYRLAFDRSALIRRLDPKVQEIYQKLFQKDSRLSLAYRTDVPSLTNEKEFITALRAKFDRIKSEERMRKTTLIGIQKDDVLAYLDDKEVYAYASQGQNRLVSLALNLAISQIEEEHYYEKPVLLLDDVLSDLDEQRRKALFTYLAEAGSQTFITSTLEPEEKENTAVYILHDNKAERRK